MGRYGVRSTYPVRTTPYLISLARYLEPSSRLPLAFRSRSGDDAMPRLPAQCSHVMNIKVT